MIYSIQENRWRGASEVSSRIRQTCSRSRQTWRNLLAAPQPGAKSRDPDAGARAAARRSRARSMGACSSSASPQLSVDVPDEDELYEAQVEAREQAIEDATMQ